MKKDPKDKLIRQLATALKNASDHLDYCGYGDSWERECAAELPKEIERALTAAKKYLPTAT